MAIFATLQAKLAVAFAAVVLVALGVSGAVFAYTNRDEEEQNEINRVAAASPAIFAEFSASAVRGVDLEEFVESSGTIHDVRVLLVDASGVVQQDSGASLKGKSIGPIPSRTQPGPGRRAGSPGQPNNSGPQDGPIVNLPADSQPGGPQRSGQSLDNPNLRDRVWYPEKGNPAEGLALISSGLPAVRFSEGPGGRTVPSFTGEGVSLVLAVEQDTLGRAWLSVLPTLGRAAAFALPVAIGLAFFLARYITRPLQQLTLASQRMADGVFDIDVPADRKDELGRLSRSFVTMAERVGESQSQMRALVANVSHDLKTPLTSILGFSRAIESGASSGETETQRIGAIIHEEAQRLSMRLNDLTFLSELDAGQALLDRDQIDLGVFVRTVASRIVPAGALLREDVLEGIVVDVDAAKLERVIENLLGNAVLYSPETSPIRLSVRAEGQLGIFALTNAAPDMHAEEAELLFQRFYRRDRARASSDGSGLGLSIAREIVERHGGFLDAEVRDGEITFRMALPRVPTD
jgi:signal transduction histidine kinase